MDTAAEHDIGWNVMTWMFQGLHIGMAEPWERITGTILSHTRAHQVSLLADDFHRPLPIAYILINLAAFVESRDGVLWGRRVCGRLRMGDCSACHLLTMIDAKNYAARWYYKYM